MKRPIHFSKIIFGFFAFFASTFAWSKSLPDQFDLICHVKGGIVAAHNVGFEGRFSGPLADVDEVLRFSIDLEHMKFVNKSWPDPKVSSISIKSKSSIYLRKNYRMVEMITANWERYYLRDKMSPYNSHVLNGTCKTMKFSGLGTDPNIKS
ncbi:MAG: hypothetical protein ABL918_12220 [Chakrabartia sp.]